MKTKHNKRTQWLISNTLELHLDMHTNKWFNIIQSDHYRRRIRKGGMETQNLFCFGKPGKVSERKSPRSWDGGDRVRVGRGCCVGVGPPCAPGAARARSSMGEGSWHIEELQNSLASETFVTKWSLSEIRCRKVGLQLPGQTEAQGDGVVRGWHPAQR